MDRVRVLAGLERRMLEAYSRRTTQALRAALPLRLALPQLEPLLARNVEKEVRKDALVIRRAAQALAAPGRDDVDALLEKGKAIDRDFLAQVGGFPIAIVLRYEEILPLRRQRIERLLDAAYRILAAWRAGRGLREALRTCYGQAELESLLSGVLRLYAMETRALSRALRLPALLRPVQDAIGQRLFAIMDAEGARLAREAARGAYRIRP